MEKDIPRFQWQDRFSEQAVTFFEENDFLIFKEFFPPTQIRSLQALSTNYPPIDFDHSDYQNIIEGTDFRLDSPKGVLVPSFLFGKKEYLDFASFLTKKNIVHFIGRVYFFNKNSNHCWHTDNAKGRTLAITLNFGDEPYQGGELLMKYKDKSKQERKIKVAKNEIVFFNIDENILHKSNEVTGPGQKKHIAGWFIRKECDL